MVGRGDVAWVTSPLWRSEPLEYGAPDLLLLESAAGDASFLCDAQGEHRLPHRVSVCGTSSDLASSQARLRPSQRLVSGEVEGRGLQVGSARRGLGTRVGGLNARARDPLTPSDPLRDPRPATRG